MKFLSPARPPLTRILFRVRVYGDFRRFQNFFRDFVLPAFKLRQKTPDGLSKLEVWPWLVEVVPGNRTVS